MSHHYVEIDFFGGHFSTECLLKCCTMLLKCVFITAALLCCLSCCIVGGKASRYKATNGPALALCFKAASNNISSLFSTIAILENCWPLSVLQMAPDVNVSYSAQNMTRL